RRAVVLRLRVRRGRRCLGLLVVQVRHAPRLTIVLRPTWTRSPGAGFVERSPAAAPRAHRVPAATPGSGATSRQTRSSLYRHHSQRNSSPAGCSRCDHSSRSISTASSQGVSATRSAKHTAFTYQSRSPAGQPTSDAERRSTPPGHRPPAPRPSRPTRGDEVRGARFADRCTGASNAQRSTSSPGSAGSRRSTHSYPGVGSTTKRPPSALTSTPRSVTALRDRMTGGPPSSPPVSGSRYTRWKPPDLVRCRSVAGNVHSCPVASPQASYAAGASCLRAKSITKRPDARPVGAARTSPSGCSHHSRSSWSWSVVAAYSPWHSGCGHDARSCHVVRQASHIRSDLITPSGPRCWRKTAQPSRSMYRCPASRTAARTASRSGPCTISTNTVSLYSQDTINVRGRLRTDVRHVGPQLSTTVSVVVSDASFSSTYLSTRSPRTRAMDRPPPLRSTSSLKRSNVWSEILIPVVLVCRPSRRRGRPTGRVGMQKLYQKQILRIDRPVGRLPGGSPGYRTERKTTFEVQIFRFVTRLPVPPMSYT